MSFCAFPRTRLTPLATLVSVSLLALSGCATKEFVQQEVGVVGSRIDTLQNLLNTVSQRIDGNSVRLNHTDIRLGQAEQTATTLGSRIDDNLAGLVAANHRLDGVSDDLAVAGRNITANTAEIARAQQRVDATEVQVQASRRRLEGTVAGLVLAENRLVVAESALKTLSQAEPSAVASKVTVVEPLQATTAVNVVPVAVPAAAPVATLGDANSRLDNIAALVATANQRIAANSSAIEGVAARLGGVENGMGATLKRTEAGEQALAATNARIGEVNEQLGTAKQTVVAQATAIVAVEKRLDEVKGVLDVGAQNLADTSTRVAQLQAGLKEESERMSRHEADAAVGSSAFKKTLTGLGTVLDGVNTRMDAADKHLADTGERVAQLQATVKEQGNRLDQNGVQVAQTVAAIKEHEERMLRDETVVAVISATAKEALERAISAGRLAEGKLLYETVLSEELTNFDLEQAKLSEAGKQALADFADKLRAENKNVFIEIQGHTDNTGSTARNQRLARERAEAVRAFLHDSGGIPLHRMAVASYGESRPLADNSTREGRMKNRRVVLVVLK